MHCHRNPTVTVILHGCRRSLVTVGLVILAGCSGHKLYCGDTFCLKVEASSANREEQVDFNVYRVVYGGNDYVIYEGNYPDTLDKELVGDLAKDMVPVGFPDGKVYKGDRGYTVVLRTQRQRWPTHLAISSGNVSELKGFVQLLRVKR